MDEHPVQIQQAAALFMNDLLKDKVQLTSSGETTETSTQIASNKNIQFINAFPKLNALSDVWKRMITENVDGRVKTSALRALLSDSVFHQAINGKLTISDFNMSADDIINQQKLVAFAATLMETEINDVLHNDESEEKQGKKLFCILYKKLKQMDEEETVPIHIDRMKGGGGQIQMQIDRRSGHTQDNLVEKVNEQADDIPEITIGLKDFIRGSTDFKKLQINDNKDLFEKDGEIDKIIDEIFNHCLSNVIIKFIKNVPTDEQKIAALILYNKIDKFKLCLAISVSDITQLKNASKIVKEFKDTINKSTKVVHSAAPKSAITSRAESPLPKELNIVSNFRIKSYISFNYFSIMEYDLPTCDNPVETIVSEEDTSNKELSGDTPPNCYTNGRLQRVSPWIKHTTDKKTRHYLVCQACGLPMFPMMGQNKINSNNTTLLSDTTYDRYDDLQNNNTMPSGKAELEKYAGITQCDHDIPIAMMFFGLNKQSDNEKYSSIGIGSNFCPLHPTCNTKKTNISPAVYWEKNQYNGIPEDEYKWNEKWGAYPIGPWMFNNKGIQIKDIGNDIQDSVQLWCKLNNWKPRYNGQLLQWKYFAALEELVKDSEEGDNSFSAILSTALKKATELYNSIDLVKDELKNAVAILRTDTQRITTKNLILSLERANAANMLAGIRDYYNIEDIIQENQELIKVNAAQQKVIDTQKRGVTPLHVQENERLKNIIAALTKRAEQAEQAEQETKQKLEQVQSNTKPLTTMEQLALNYNDSEGGNKLRNKFKTKHNKRKRKSKRRKSKQKQPLKKTKKHKRLRKTKKLKTKDNK